MVKSVQFNYNTQGGFIIILSQPLKSFKSLLKGPLHKRELHPGEKETETWPYNFHLGID